MVPSKNTQTYIEQPESSADVLDKASRKFFLISAIDVGTAM